MNLHVDRIRMQLSAGPMPTAKLLEKLGISQPSMSRALAKLGDEIVRLGAAKSIHYSLRDTNRRLPDIPVYRVTTEGLIRELGTLIPVRPDGFVMQQKDGKSLHSDSLPWWLFDMRPQGYLSRAFVARYGAELGLPDRLKDWTDTHALRALLLYGHDIVGNILLGGKCKGSIS